MKLYMKHQRPKPLIFGSNYDRGMTLTYFMVGKIFNLGFYMGKCDNDGFLDIIASCEDSYSKLSELFKYYIAITCKVNVCSAV